MKLRGRELGHALRVRLSRAAAVDEIARAAQTSRGLGAKVAQSLGVSHRTLDNWVEEYPEVRAALVSARAAHKSATSQKGKEPSNSAGKGVVSPKPRGFTTQRVATRPTD